jgi:3-deoxy-D-arabino-heptulosonate 7-phosphate (DAHP) synthase
VFDTNTISLAFPEANQLEVTLRETEEYHDNIQAKVNSESRAAELLASAVEHLDLCRISMENAREFKLLFDKGSFHSFFPL